MSKLFFALVLLGLVAVASAAPAPKAVAGAECVLCEFVITKLESELSANATAAEIEAALNNICSQIPSTLRSECTNFVNTYTPTLIALLIGKLPPAQVCTTLGLCSSKKEMTIALPKASVTCAICEFVIRELDQKLVSNGTVAELEKEFELVCNRLPSTIRQECDSLVTLYTPQLVQALVNKVDPQIVCSYTHLCTAADILLQKILPVY